MKEKNLNQYPEFYRGYASLAPEDTVVSALTNAGLERKQLLSEWPKALEDYAYAEGKWTVKELMLHMIDSERVFIYRALRFSRGDSTELPGYEQDDWVPTSGANERSFSSIYKEMRQVRKSAIQLFKNLTDIQLKRMGTANGVQMNAEQLGFIIAGHERHHLGVLRERYLDVGAG